MYGPFLDMAIRLAVKVLVPKSQATAPLHEVMAKQNHQHKRHQCNSSNRVSTEMWYEIFHAIEPDFKHALNGTYM